MIRLPKTYHTLGMRFKITRKDNMDVAGEVDWEKEEIHVDKYHEDDFQLSEVLVHETLEATLIAHGDRYVNRFGKYVFVLDHDQFQNVCSEFARVVLDTVNANRGGKDA